MCPIGTISASTSGTKLSKKVKKVKKKKRDEFLELEVEPRTETVEYLAKPKREAPEAPTVKKPVVQRVTDITLVKATRLPTIPDIDIPGVTVTTTRCPKCSGFINLKVSSICYSCGYVHIIKPIRRV